MRLTLVTDAWHPQINGVVTSLSKTTDGLRRRGHAVTDIEPGPFRTVPCPSEPTLRLAMFPRRRVAWLLDGAEPEAIHVATEGPLGLAAWRHCLRCRWPFTTSYCTRFPEYIQIRLRIPARLTCGVVRWFHRPSHCVMVSTETLRGELERRGFSNLGLWPRGVDTELFRPRPRDFVDAERPLFIYMGRVAVEKNIEAFLRLALPGTKGVIGDGPALGALRTRYPQIRFFGMRVGEELARLLACADVFVFPSRTDTFGLVMLEALACGVPVAAYPVQGPLNVIENGVTGVLAEDLRVACLRALELDRHACREAALQHSWERVAEQFESNLVPIAV